MEKQEQVRLLLSGEWRDWIIQEARSWLSTPYVHRARIKGVGVDCGGLIYEIYNPLFGPFRPFPREYNPDWALHGGPEIYLDFVGPYVERVLNPVPGGLSIYHVGRAWAHGAIYTRDDTFVHAWGAYTSGHVKEDAPRAFDTKSGVRRSAIHYDVSKKWLSSLSQH